MAKTKTLPEVFEPMQVKAYIEDKEGEVMTGIATDESVDRDGEIISIDGWDLKDFKKNPVLLYGHNRVLNHSGTPVGKVSKIGIKEVNGKKALVFDFILEEITQFGKDLKQLVKEGFLNTFSVGFLPMEREGNKFTSQKLLEISLVAVPSNANALILQRAFDGKISYKSAYQVLNIKNVIPHKEFPLAPEETTWSGQAAQGRLREAYGGKKALDFTKYKDAFTWFNKEIPERTASYKMPHHDIRDGEMVTVFKGVVSSMNRLSTMDIPDKDKKRAYKHLSKHYLEFGKEAPDFKLLESGQLKEMLEICEQEAEAKYFKETKNTLRELRQEIKQSRSTEVKEANKPSVAGFDPKALTIAVETLSKSVENALNRLGKVS